ncbi:SDR family oxidoreductase [Marispirochaeta sp.]|uniref:SDR family oxidoreductase n=1 Tax=Marispirochaeta sp. TaxID=2038653 RepID=UPI0029C9A139|nr:SDR family oxidoreductase [Marispirochaeta sp.]
MIYPDLRGKTALISGGAKRIGAACALALAGAGADIVLHYHRSQEESQKTAELITSKGVKAWTVKADLESEQETRDLFDKAVELSGGIDILVNSASIFPAGTIDAFTWEDLEQNLKINTWAPLVLSRLFAAQKHFSGLADPPEAEQLGNIVNLLDTRITDNDKEHAAYALSKRSLFSLTRMLSIACAPAVKVNAIAPGLILPPPGKNEAFLDKLRHTNPMRRVGRLEDISSALLFLISNSFISGQVIFVDGGRRIRGSMYGV